MYGDALKEFLVFPRALYSQGPVYLVNNYPVTQYNIFVSNIQLKQHTLGYNNISVLPCTWTQYTMADCEGARFQSVRHTLVLFLALNCTRTLTSTEINSTRVKKSKKYGSG